MKIYCSLFVLFSLFLSCQLEPQNQFGINWDMFNSQQKLWQEQNRTNYSFYLSYNQNKGQIWNGTIIVKDGYLLDFITDEFSNFSYYVFVHDPAADHPVMKWINTIDGIYYEIISLSNDASTDESDYYTHFNISYDTFFHIPRYFTYSRKKQSLFSANSTIDELAILQLNPDIVIADNQATVDMDNCSRNQQMWQEQSISNYSFHLDYYFDDGTVTVGNGINYKGFTFSGTVFVKNGQLNNYTIDKDELGYSMDAPVYGAWRWIDSFTDFFDTILADSIKNPGLEWGCQSQSSLELVYDSVYHFPSYYRYFAQEMPGENSSGKQRLYEINITDFTIIP